MSRKAVVGSVLAVAVFAAGVGVGSGVAPQASVVAPENASWVPAQVEVVDDPLVAGLPTDGVVESPDGSMTIENTSEGTDSTETVITEISEDGSVSELAVVWEAEPMADELLDDMNIVVDEDWSVSSVPASVGDASDGQVFSASYSGGASVAFAGDEIESDLDIRENPYGDGNLDPAPIDPFLGPQDSYEKVRCDGGRVFSDAKGTVSWQLACPGGKANWGYRLSPAVQEIVVGLVTELGLDWTKNSNPKPANAGHVVGAAYQFHGTIGGGSPILPPDVVHYWDTFFFRVDGGNARLRMWGTWQAAPKSN